MAKKIIRIATRQSPLALWQAEHVAALLVQAYPDVTTELVKMVTRGDKILDAPLAKVGGKGLFVKELEQGMLEGTADIAVHSMKNLLFQNQIIHYVLLSKNKVKITYAIINKSN